MFDLAAKIILAPVLIAQGTRVRKTALKLPEPDGPRSGTCGRGPDLRLLILGDSSAAGVGADDQAQSLSGQVAAGLAPHLTLHWRLWARTGATTASTLACLVKAEAEPIDLAIVCLGVNDVTGGRFLRPWLADQALLFDTLGQKFCARRIISCGLPPMGRFPLLPQPLRWFLGRQATVFDDALSRLCAGRPECHFVRAEQALDASLMARDGFHPGPEIYRLWGADLAARILDLVTACPTPARTSRPADRGIG